MRRSLVSGRVLIALVFAVCANSAWANCTVSTGGLNFGNYDVFNPTPLAIRGAIQVTCDAGTAYTIILGTGNSGGYSQRELWNGGAVLLYNLYTGPAVDSPVWGDGTGATASVAGSSDGNTRAHDVYGRVPARQNVSVGTYTDAIVITVEF